MIKWIVVLTAALLFSGQVRAASDEDAIRALLMKEFDRPESRLSVEPIVVVGDHSIAGWAQAELGGRALLRRRHGHHWQLILCSGDGIKSAEAMQQAGIPASQASELASALAYVEAMLPKERIALFAKFEGTVMMGADGSHPPVHHGQGHGAQHAQAHPQHTAAPHALAPKTFKLGAIKVDAPWLRATPQGAQVAGGYMKITNTGNEPDRLIGGTLEKAGRFEVHEMTLVDNVMRMRELAQGLEINPGQSLELKPGGYHIMGMALQGGYTQGQSIKGTLVFEKAGTVQVEYVVAPIGGASTKHGMH
jgi:copper(I)-binding protein